MTHTLAERRRRLPVAARHFEPHIQGLRAVAVLLVVVFHFWPGRLSGGFIGVDIFFVISGFLITAHLVRELTDTQRINLPQFWSRRIRRLLPASIAVLLFCSVATLLVLPLSGLGDTVREILASTFYIENWVLAANSVDYLAAENDPTMAQHYWTLSLEEQFYVLWPLLLLAGVSLGAKFLTQKRTAALVTTVIVVSALSLVFSVVYTALEPAPAFFVTFTRMWEFGAGALLALLPALRPRSVWANAVLGYGGLLVILVTAYLYGPSTPFPGYMAILPVFAAVAVIAARRSERWWEAGSILSLRPARFIGDISYSLYLWHWPLVVIAPYVPGWGLTTAHRLTLFVLCFVLAWLTKKFVEDPGRQWRYLTRRRPRVTAAFAVVLMAVSAAFAGVAYLVNQPRYEAAAAELQAIREDFPECFGALSLGGCDNPELEGLIVPSPGFGNADSPEHEECFVQLNNSELVACEFGSEAADAPRVALIGDSHAYQYIEAMITLAEERGWALTTYLKGACPWNAAEVGGPSAAFTASCDAWKQNLRAELESGEPFDAIFTAALATTPYPGSDADAAAAGFTEAWAWAGDAPIVTIVDNPDLSDDPNKCLRQNSIEACAEPRDSVLVEDDPIAIAGAEASELLDLTELYCDEESCHVVVSGANVYRDQDHLTVTWTLSMRELLGDAIERALDRG
ncbi:acyltransferase [Salinibacterium sp. SYSU T00001]|uniref:acyltransferase family protein n=1 Tax=Homoserinimonas sedimenticola TaxID=2986805 RepID=UPI0022367B06|nr:acyltransferase family protein [Salinibacterium sedimenticola]MCW4385587.1 acyltransferase [Salinibacterium sedimenticola]